MTRATTPTHRFYFDTDPSLYEKILITYAQNYRIVLEKTKDDFVISEIDNPSTGQKPFEARYTLTQEETNMFSANREDDVQIQVRVKTTAGEVLASTIKNVKVYEVLNDEVL